MIKAGLDPAEMIQCLKQYLALEEWFHAENHKDKVRSAKKDIAEVVDLIQTAFPRRAGNEWRLKKKPRLCQNATGYFAHGGAG